MESKNLMSKTSNDEVEELSSKFPTAKFWNDNFFCLHENFWYPSIAVKAVVSFQSHFEARDTDLMLISVPNSGTTWIKALSHSILHRFDDPNFLKNSPLLTTRPHELIPYFELRLYLNNPTPNLDLDLKNRVFATHISYSCLLDSIKDSDCRIVYVCRNPVDQFISNWHFFSNVFKAEPQVPLADFFDLFCSGVYTCGPYWDHVLGFWHASLERPEKILFFKYEDMKMDTPSHIRRLAEFFGFPFSPDEEKGNVVDEIMNLCSFNTLKDLETNKNGCTSNGMPKNVFFRKGEVGDGYNHLSPSMIERLRKLMDEKLAGSGLTFNISTK